MSTPRTARTVNLHRALDEAFAAAPPGPETQDLKEEVRGSLLARAGALESEGVPADQAARRALDELGDLREIVASVADPDPGGGALGHAALVATHRVRPKPVFVVRVLLAAVLAAGAVVLVALVATGVLDWSVAAGTACALVAALGIGAIIADGLRQETTGSYPLPIGRALGFGVAGAAAVAALGLGGLFAADLDRAGLAVAAGVLLVAAIVGFVLLGVTQTNRTKPWMRELGMPTAVDNRFSREPAVAARYGIYSGALWLVAMIAFVALSITVGFAWSWLALVITLPVQLVVLARMLFPSTDRTDA